MKKNPSERLFFLDNDQEVNRLVFKIGWVFMGVLFGILLAAYFDVFKVEPVEVLYIMAMLLVTEIIFFFLLHFKVKTEIVKYYGLLAMETCLIKMISNAYFGIYMCYILVPVISCLYFDRKLTRNITIISYVGMLLGLWLRAPVAMELAYPGYPSQWAWFVAFGLGYTLEYIALSAVLISVAMRSRRYMEELYHRRENIGDIQNKIIYRFADLVESRDDNTGKHIKRTSRYVVLIANRLRCGGVYEKRLNDAYVVNIELAAPLHDIGKIVVSDSILRKPGKLTTEEFELIKTHTSEGRKIVVSSMRGIEGEDFLQVARDIAQSHHEKWDGTGYPDGLKGEQIPLSARIMAVADVFDALVSERCYKNPIPIDEAFEIIRQGRGTHFDPVVADAFLGAESEVREIFAES